VVAENLLTVLRSQRNGQNVLLELGHYSEKKGPMLRIRIGSASRFGPDPGLQVLDADPDPIQNNDADTTGSGTG
jgi:hypothetical protein